MERRSGILIGSDRCFVDTECWIALLNKRDNLHKTADTIYKHRMESGSSLVTTSCVLTETFNALANPAFKPSVIAFRRHPGWRSSLSIPPCG